MSVTRQKFNLGEPSWHLIDTPEGERYRLWDKEICKYISDPLTREKMHEWHLFDRLSHYLCTEGIAPDSVFVRNLTNVGWWKEGECLFAHEDAEEDDAGGDVDYDECYDSWADNAHPEGQCERHFDFDRDIVAQQTEADLCASVALEAIKAYRAYVANGGDPTVVPALSFEDGEFSVEMVARQKL